MSDLENTTVSRPRLSRREYRAMRSYERLLAKKADRARNAKGYGGFKLTEDSIKLAGTSFHICRASGASDKTYTIRDGRFVQQFRADTEYKTHPRAF